MTSLNSKELCDVSKTLVSTASPSNFRVCKNAKCKVIYLECIPKMSIQSSLKKNLKHKRSSHKNLIGSRSERRN